MADKISASITYLDANNNKGTKAITDISPTADNGAIKNFCVGLLGLTTNTLSQIDRVEKTDITTATTKPKLSLTLTTQATETRFAYNMEAQFGYTLFNETVTAGFVYRLGNQGDEGRPVNCMLNIFRKGNFNDIYFSACTFDDHNSYPNLGVTVYVYFDETDTTAATTVKIRFFQSQDATLTIL